MMTADVQTNDILAALQDVRDPEIPTISVVDLGVITHVTLLPNEDKVQITMTPTFTGCPAIEVMTQEVRARVEQMGIASVVEVRVDYSTPWSSNRVTERGREALKKHGLATPQRFEGEFEPEILLNAQCPFCSSTHTTLQTPFGPTLCRAIYYCNSCKQAFEQFKPV